MMYLKRISLFLFNNQQLIRENSSKSLILKSKTQRKNATKKCLESSIKKKVSKSKASQRKIIQKSRLPSDYDEGIWLDNINLQNLKLFRKTSFGSFRKIKLNNLIQKLKQLECDSSETNFQIVAKNISAENYLSKYENLKSTKENESLYGSPQMSEYLVHNMTAFPLLKTNCNEVFTEILKNEKEEYGLVDTVKFPSVTTILNDTMPESAKSKLRRWKEKLISQMGEAGFEQYSKDPEKTVVNSCKKMFIESRRQHKQILIDLRNRGSKLHHCLKDYFKTGTIENINSDPYVSNCWKSLETLLPNISEIKMVEETLYHPALMYKGIVDCVANYEGNPCVIDWKKSEKEKKDLSETFDAPLQVSAYLGALCWKKDADPLTKGVVIVAYTSGEPAAVFKMDSDSCQFYWLEWLRRLQTYWLKRSSILDQVEANF